MEDINHTIHNLIEQYGEEGDFTGSVSSVAIKQAEELIDTQFSPEYRWFIEKYGSGGVLGIDIIGIGKNNSYVVSKITRRLREQFNLPNNLIVIEDCDAFYYCLNTDDSKVYFWDKIDEMGEIVALDFLSFLEERINDMRGIFYWYV
ncbi:SMI1/KNR4 family protein [Listeria booriae]|uniref:SMI1/KNR4 family protein n=1 Tax=Listeria booriae TaxID=1552123 RepID=UPI0016233237|nr:SMI1/KNR4 family protein [Listeria booriae]MBC1804920.1 SMI1/KNR4 family protein [Listeria booriae]